MQERFPSVTTLFPDLKTRNHEAWNELVNGFHAGLLSMARSLIRTSSIKKELSAEDLVQEVFIKAWRKFSGFQGVSTVQLAKWLIIILRNTFFNHCKRRRMESANGISSFFSEDASPSQELISLENDARLHAHLAMMDPQTRVILSMKFFEGMTFREIADQLESKTSTIYSIYKRGISTLAVKLQVNPVLT